MSSCIWFCLILDSQLFCIQLLPIHTLRLGVELDSFDGHHYVSSVAPGGPVDKHGVLRPEDELLEVSRIAATAGDLDESLARTFWVWVPVARQFCVDMV